MTSRQAMCTKRVTPTIGVSLTGRTLLHMCAHLPEHCVRPHRSRPHWPGLASAPRLAKASSVAAWVSGTWPKGFPRLLMQVCEVY